MPQQHPLSYLVSVSRHSNLMHSEMVSTREEALSLVAKFESFPGTEADITEVHDRAETDLAAHTRELVEDLQLSRQY